MRTALDSSVLLAIFNDEPGSGGWVEALIAARKEGQLVLCEIVFAEVSAAFSARSRLESALETLGVQLDPIQAEAAWLAGRNFLDYRRAGGPREHLIPDFLIAAHARIQADRLAAVDRGYYRRYFPGLVVMGPA